MLQFDFQDTEIIHSDPKPTTSQDPATVAIVRLCYFSRSSGNNITFLFKKYTTLFKNLRGNGIWGKF